MEPISLAVRHNLGLRSLHSLQLQEVDLVSELDLFGVDFSESLLPSLLSLLISLEELSLLDLFGIFLLFSPVLFFLFLHGLLVLLFGLDKLLLFVGDGLLSLVGELLGLGLLGVELVEDTYGSHLVSLGVGDEEGNSQGNENGFHVLINL